MVPAYNKSIVVTFKTVKWFMTPEDKKHHGTLFVRYRSTGDTAAFTVLVEAFRVPLHTYLRKMLGNDERAEDAFQEVWLRVVRRADSYEDQGLFSSWLYRIAHNYCLDEYRRQGREQTISEPDLGSDVSFWSTVPDERMARPDERLIEREIQERLDQAVEALPPRLKEVYLLRSVSEVPFKELAELYECPLGTVLGWMHQAMKKIRNHLLANGIVEEELNSASTRKTQRA